MLRGVPITLPTQYQRQVATWLVLKIMIIERARPHNAVIPLDDLVNFMNTSNIPRSVKLWIAHHDVEDWYTSLYTESNLITTVTQSPPISGDIRNIQVTTLGIGHLFVFAFITTNPEIHFEPEMFKQFGFIKRLWPIESRNIHWPPVSIHPIVPAMLSLSLEALLNAPFAERRDIP